MNSNVTPSMARSVSVTPRLPPFVFDDPGVQGVWFGGDVGRTAAWNALGTVAGAGEPGIMDAGRWLVEHIDDPVLADKTRRFVQQEALHSTVHARLNRALASHGLPIDRVRDLVVSLIEATVLGAAYAVVLLIAAWRAASWAMVPAADRARRSRPSTWGPVNRQMSGRGALVRGAARNLTALLRVDFHPFDMHDPAPTLGRLRDALVDPARERPMRAVAPGITVDRPTLAPVGLWDLAALARFAAFAVRRAPLFMWTVR